MNYLVLYPVKYIQRYLHYRDKETEVQNHKILNLEEPFKKPQCSAYYTEEVFGSKMNYEYDSTSCNGSNIYSSMTWVKYFTLPKSFYLMSETSCPLWSAVVQTKGIREYKQFLKALSTTDCINCRNIGTHTLVNAHCSLKSYTTLCFMRLHKNTIFEWLLHYVQIRFHKHNYFEYHFYFLHFGGLIVLIL